MSLNPSTWSPGQSMALKDDAGDTVLSIDEDGVSTEKGYQHTPYAATATADGTGTGVIPDDVGMVLVTSAGANNIVTLPAPVAGHRILILIGDNGCELRSNDPENVAINGGTASAAELALAADSITEAIAISATAWLVRSGSVAGGFNMAAAGA